MEIYNDNELEKGFRPQVGAFKLPTEPWAFAIDRDGKVAARLEGAYSEARAASMRSRPRRRSERSESERDHAPRASSA